MGGFHPGISSIYLRLCNLDLRLRRFYLCLSSFDLCQPGVQLRLGRRLLFLRMRAGQSAAGLCLRQLCLRQFQRIRINPIL